jgi:hypothetical protein
LAQLDKRSDKDVNISDELRSFRKKAKMGILIAERAGTV